MRGRGPAPLLVIVLGTAVALMTGVTAVVLAADGADSRSRPSSAAPVEPRAVRLLRAWDRRRAEAFARGDAAALSALYADGSRTGAADRSVLDGYLRRGLTVTHMTTQVLAAVVVGESGGRIEMRVTDVLVDAVVTDREGRRWSLPRDQPSTRRVVLVQRDGRWLVAETYPAD